MSAFVAQYLTFLITALNVAIFGRVIMSFVSPAGDDPISRILIQITEPILAPIRRYMPKMGMFDLAPMVALALLNFIVRPVVTSLF